LVAEAFGRATGILRSRRADLDEGARLLLAQETLTADQFPALRSTVQPTKLAALLGCYGSDFLYAPASAGASFTATLDAFAGLSREARVAIER